MNFIPPQDETRLRAAASGVLPNGRPVIVNADGTVSVVAEIVANNASSGSLVAYSGDTVAKTNMGLTFDSNSSKTLVTYFQNATYAKVGTVSGTAISFGNAVQVTSNEGADMSATFDSNSNKVVIAYKDNGNSGKGTAAVGTISGTSVSFGTPVVFEQGSTSKTASAFDSNSNKVVIAYKDAGNSNYGTAIVGTVSGTGISFGSPVVFEAAEVSGNIGITFDSSSNKIVISYYDDPASDGTAIVGTVSGTSISFGTAVVFEAGAIEQPHITFDSSTNRVVIAYRDGGNSNYGTAITGNVSGTSLSFGTKVVYLSQQIENPNITFDSSNNKAVAIAVDDENYDYGKASVITPTSDGTTLTAENYIGMSGGAVSFTGSAASTGSAVVYNSGASKFQGAAFDSNSNKIIIAYMDAGNSEHGTAIVGTVNNSDNSISFGSEVVFQNSAIRDDAVGMSVVFDSNVNRVVICYRDNNYKGSAIVGTVSGTSISFGTAVVFSDASTDGISAAFDSNVNKIAIAYNLGDAGKGIVGTVDSSDNSISFGSEAALASTNVSESKSTVFDSNSNKIVVSYGNTSSSTIGTSVVGTISGTNISFGTPAAFNATAVANVKAAFDSNSNKVVVFYQDSGNSSKGTSVVGTVSGTGISFGTPVVFETSATNYFGATFDSVNNRAIVAYQISGSCRVSAGSVSGTSISFSDFTEYAIAQFEVSLAVDTNSDRLVVAFRDDRNSQYGTAKVIKIDTKATNRGQVASGSSASVDIIGTVSENQTGLTAGQQYFVQTDGTIGLTAGSPSVFAGTAISPTKLLVKT